MVIKRKVATRKPKGGAAEVRLDPWWQIAPHTVQVFGWYYDLSERTIARLKAQGVDLRDVRAVLEAQAENCRMSRGPLRAALQRWCEWQAGRNRNREALLGPNNSSLNSYENPQNQTNGKSPPGKRRKTGTKLEGRSRDRARPAKAKQPDGFREPLGLSASADRKFSSV